MSQGTTTTEAGASGDRTVVTTREELETAFAELSPGETVRITDENAPYRTTRWLDVDVDDVTVVGPGVRNLIQPAEGAAVGGIRIGHDSRCRAVDVRGVGFRGTLDKRNSAERLHAVAVRDAANVTIERNYVRGTYPIAHGNGGSGISVTRDCSDVWIANNRIREFGDRGIQLGGRRIVVSGNVVTAGLDRPVACDVWYPDAENATAGAVSVFGNLLGDSVEGSLVGVARNDPVRSNEGFVSVFGNVGFGSHKSFCHVRGPEPVRNVSVRNNVSLQTTDVLGTDQRAFAGVAVDPAAGRNLAIENNALYGYSGHGVHVDSEVTDFTVRNNVVVDAGLSGVRIVDGEGGVVDGNLVTETGGVGVRLRRTANVAVRGNYVRRAGTAGIVSEGTPDAGDEVADNYVVGTNREADDPRPAILVRNSGVRVRDNAVRRSDGPAIADADGAARNVYQGNWADGDRPWCIRSPDSRVRGNVPPAGVHRENTPDAEDAVVRVAFDRPHADPPRLEFGRRAGGVGDVSFVTDEDGNYVGAEIAVDRRDGTLDVFVRDG